MYPPSDVCKALYKIHPQLRLCWLGRERAHSDELNAGSFGIVQLYHVRDAGTPDEPLSFREFFDVGIVPDTYGGPALARIDRGTIFSRTGSSRRDWDPHTRVPMLIADLSAYGVTHDDVYSKRFLALVREWLRPAYERVAESAKAKGRGLRRAVEDIAADASSELWKDAQKSDAASVTLAKKHAKEDVGVQQLNKWRDKGGTAQLEDAFMPPPLPQAP